ncbi:hypothetical protein BGX26_001152 [Mortierella sp. AD094]|nr:hypothetical protein BGX26_001152 [Mortierella sp. AD094]
MLPPLPSTIVATVYITLLTILSCVQFRRSQTPLRLGAAVMALFGLSISALSIVYTTDKVSLSIFWVYQFVAECIAVTWVIVTIIQLGYTFYPLTRHQTLIWRTALGSVILYDLIAICELSYYCYGVWGSGSLSKEGTPIVWIYWVRQVAKVLACAVTIAYLFVPLVRHHHSTGVAMIADSNTLAVGTWYLSALGFTSLGYVAMFIYYMTRSKEVFSPQAQALDLCIRLMSCPIFSLPPPQFLISYFRKKYGSAARDDNPNTMIEEGITNDPRPRRPPMLVSQPTSHSTRRDSAYVFGPAYQERSVAFHSPYSSYEIDEDRCKHYLDEKANIGTTSSLDTAAETSPKLKPLSKLSASNLKESKASTETSKDEAMLSSLSISASTERPSTPNSEEITVATPPLSFAQGVAPERNEQEETALAARRISRRLTMEGRKDGLDFLNITGLMKRTHCPITGPGQKSTTSIAGLGTGVGSHPSLPTSISETSFSPSRHYGETRERNTQPSALKRGGGGKLSVISDSSMTEDDDKTGLDSKISQDNHYTHIIVSMETPEQVQGQENLSDKQLVVDMEQYDTQMDTLSDRASSHHPMVHQSDSAAPEQQQHDSSSSSRPINKKMSMDNIRKMSRDALTRFQEGVFGASIALSNSATTGPLSPTILRAERDSYGLDAKPTATITTSSSLPQLSSDYSHV